MPKFFLYCPIFLFLVWAICITISAGLYGIVRCVCDPGKF